VIPIESEGIKDMRCLFVVQGEGRGHMTQAIALRHMLENAGHSLERVLVGTSPRREIPSFFPERIGVPVTRFESPNFVPDANNRGILVGRTMIESLKRSPAFFKSAQEFDRTLREIKPDVVVNFYEPLFGLYATLRKPRCPSACIAHQCLSLHPAFPFPPGHRRDKSLLRTLTRITTSSASAILALSFTPLDEMIRGRIRVVPPVLRPEVFSHNPTADDYLLIYVMSDGYAEDVMAWHEKRPETKLHCFWDRKGAPDEDRRDETLTLHRLSDTGFLEKMAGCRGLVTTAGFESVCEAMYLGKPVMMIPVQGHYEQLCNSVDGVRAGAGIRSDGFDLDRFLDYLPTHSHDTDGFRAWVTSAQARIVPILESLVTGH